MQDISNYGKIREDARNFYEKISVVRCPALNNEAVHFSAEGYKTRITGEIIYKKIKQKHRAKGGIFVVPAFSLRFSRTGLTPHKHIITIIILRHKSRGVNNLPRTAIHHFLFKGNQ